MGRWRQAHKHINQQTSLTRLPKSTNINLSAALATCNVQLATSTVQQVATATLSTWPFGAGINNSIWDRQKSVNLKSGNKSMARGPVEGSLWLALARWLIYLESNNHPPPLAISEKSSFNNQRHQDHGSPKNSKRNEMRNPRLGSRHFAWQAITLAIFSTAFSCWSKALSCLL